MQRSNPFAEPLLIALLSLLVALSLVSGEFVWWVVQPGQKDAVVVGLFGTLLGFVGGGINALVQALSRDPQTARANAQAAAANAQTVQTAMPSAPPPVIVVPAPPPVDPPPTVVTGPDGGPVQTEDARA